MRVRKAAYALPAVLVAVFAIAAMAWWTLDHDASEPNPHTAISQAALPRVTAPPEPRFTRAMSAATTLAKSDPALDRCAGPVAVDVNKPGTTLVSEHNYCGGSAWISKLAHDDVVKLTGVGVDDGIYIVQGIKGGTRHKATVADLPDAPVVLETCISKTKLVMVALVKYTAEEPQPA